jgi:two-component system OmpR family sensor kinase
VGRLFWKIFLAFWVTLVVAAAGTGTAVWLQRRAHEAAPPDELALGPPHHHAVDMAAATLQHGGIAALGAWMKEFQRLRPVPLYVVDEQGRDFLGREVNAGALAKARAAAASEPQWRGARLVTAADGKSYLLFVPQALAPRPRGSPGARPDPREPPLPPWEFIAIGVATSLAFSALLAWYLARPIRSLRWAFDAAAAGRLDTRVGPRMGRRRDEIADLGRDFDRMAQQLQSLVSSQRRLLHDVSHELRSPLARLQAAIGLARQDPSRLEATLGRIERESSRLDELVGEVLTLARLETGTAQRAREKVDLVHLAASIAEDARFEAETLGRKLAFSGEGEALVVGSAALLHRAVENVVRNAVKFTREASTVEVLVHVEGNSAVVSVTDHGPGVPPADLEKIFDPFYRGESSAGTSGFGLGLAIAQRAVDAHGGRIRAANVPGGGLRIDIELPLPSFTSNNRA